MLQLALRDAQRDVSRTYITIRESAEGETLFSGFFTLRAGTLSTIHIPTDAQAALPEGIQPGFIPVVSLDGLARDERFKGENLGLLLLIGALAVSVAIADYIGAAGIFLTATSESGYRLYQSFNFYDFPPLEHAVPEEFYG